MTFLLYLLLILSLLLLFCFCVWLAVRIGATAWFRTVNEQERSKKKGL
jgi:hypothetical protein